MKMADQLVISGYAGSAVQRLRNSTETPHGAQLLGLPTRRRRRLLHIQCGLNLPVSAHRKGANRRIELVTRASHTRVGGLNASAALSGASYPAQAYTASSETNQILEDLCTNQVLTMALGLCQPAPLSPVLRLEVTAHSMNYRFYTSVNSWWQKPRTG